MITNSGPNQFVAIGKRWLREYLFSLSHHGIKGQKWGVCRGPPYPLKRSGNMILANSESSGIIKRAIVNGEVSTKVNREKQLRHTLKDHLPGRSYLFGDLAYAQRLIDEQGGKGYALTSRDAEWNQKELVTFSRPIGAYVDMDGNESPSAYATIIYSKSGTHIFPRKGTIKK